MEPPPFPLEGEMFDLHLTAESTLFRDLESFVRFSRLRKFEDARNLYAKLEPHLDDAFLVTIEYADLLFEQGDYRTLSDFLEYRIDVQTKMTGEERLAPKVPEADEEIRLLEVMKSLADIFTKGALRSALVQARRCREFLARKHEDSLKHSRKLPTNVQLDLYVRDISRHHCICLPDVELVELGDMDPPWSNAMPPGSGVLRWFKTLQDNGYLCEASRVLRVILPVLPMLPSNDVASLIFIEQNHEQERLERAPAQVNQSEWGKSDRWAHLAMNLSKAQCLLDTIVREYNPSPESRLGHEVLYARGQDYLNMALDESNQTRTPNLEVALEQRDYSFIGKNTHLGAPSLEFQKLVVSKKDYRLHVLEGVQKLLHPPDGIQSTDWQKTIEKILECQRISGDLVGFIRAWEFLATIVLSSWEQPKYDKPAKLLLTSVRDVFKLHMMDTLKLQRTAAGKPIPSTHLVLLGMTTSEICKYEFADTLSYSRTSKKEDYPMEFDIPLCLWTFMQKKEQLSLNNLLLEGPDPGNDYRTRKIDMDAVKTCLPNFIKSSDQLGTQDGSKGGTTTVRLEGSIRVDGNMAITGNVHISIPGDLHILGDLIISDGAFVQPSMKVVGTANIDKGKQVKEPGGSKIEV